MHWRATSRTDFGGENLPGSHYGNSTPADLNLYPIRHPIKQLAIDVLAILSGVMLACVAASAVGVSVYVLFFMKVS